MDNAFRKSRWRCKLFARVKSAMDSGAPWFEFTARDLPFANQMTPQMAALDIENKKQVALAKAKQEQEAAAAGAQAEARIKAMPLAGPAYSRQVANYVQQDARGWGFNHLDGGSIHNVRVASGSVKSGTLTLRGEYTFNGGQPGWVLVNMVAGKLNCIQFWDAIKWMPWDQD